LYTNDYLFLALLLLLITASTSRSSGESNFSIPVHLQCIYFIILWQSRIMFSDVFALRLVP